MTPKNATCLVISSLTRIRTGVIVQSDLASCFQSGAISVGQAVVKQAVTIIFEKAVMLLQNKIQM